MRTLRKLAALTSGLLLAATTLSAQNATGAPSPRLLTPENSVLIMIDHQPQMAFGVASHDRASIINNATGLAKAAKVFNVPTILTTVAAESFSGQIFPQIKAVFPDAPIIDRSTMNAWEDQRVIQAVKKTGRKKIIIAGLWSEVCVVMPALSALSEGYEVYVVSDASGGVTAESHDMAMRRMIQAGAVPVTWLQVLLEYQRDWARQGTYAAVTDIVVQHGGAYGLGIGYTKTMFHSSGEGAKH